MRFFLFLACAAAAFTPQARANYTFNNGDPNISSNFLDCGTCRAPGGVKVYEDFDVPLGGWILSGISGNYSFLSAPILPTQGVWEIRTGMSQGVAGTLVATGTATLTDTLISNPPGCNCPSEFTYHIAVTIPGLSLTQGTYWVTLAPNSAASEPYLWAANGTNGTNAKIDGLSFVTGPYWTGPQNIGVYESQFGGSAQQDWSMQLITDTPEPGSIALLSLGLAFGLAGRRLRMRRGGISSSR